MTGALRQWLTRPEVIGDPACPIMRRWTLLNTRRWKLLLHHFLPNADDRAPHDHPRPFGTMVLAGGYDDLVPCPACDGTGDDCMVRPTLTGCARCAGALYVVGDRMRPGAVRFRRAEHRHRTRVGPSGCWTLVVMGPQSREWGFWLGDSWWPWRDFERTFGHGMRCPGTDAAGAPRPSPSSASGVAVKPHPGPDA